MRRVEISEGWAQYRVKIMVDANKPFIGAF